MSTLRVFAVVFGLGSFAAIANSQELRSGAANSTISLPQLGSLRPDVSAATPAGRRQRVVIGDPEDDGRWSFQHGVAANSQFVGRSSIPLEALIAPVRRDRRGPPPELCSRP